MLTTPTFRILASATLIAVGALALTGCDAQYGSGGLSFDAAQKQLDLPAGVPETADDFAYIVADGQTFVSWAGDRVDDPTCSEDGSSIPKIPADVTRGAEVDGAVEQCDFGHQVTSDGRTFVWMKQ
jgi:hypothetical protein